MSAPAQTPRPKPKRTMHYNASCGVLFLHVHRCGEEETAYFVDEIRSDLGGRGFELTKIRDRSCIYHVHVTPDGTGDSCDCKGSSRWGHCKHSGAIAALLERGDIA